MVFTRFYISKITGGAYPRTPLEMRSLIPMAPPFSAPANMNLLPTALMLLIVPTEQIVHGLMNEQT